ncbi:MAG TPA: hypothetical protein VLT61_09510 [Anaeromyxobacteraceae bacterium]|nr:hypothetical protein [Anaeromyxobacteraceae bacterium]
MRSLLLPILVVSAGCMIVPPHVMYRAPGAPPPAAPAQRLLSEREAVDIARGEAASRGVQVDSVKHAHLDGDGRWHVDLRGRGHGKAKVIVDARSGRVLKADVKAGKAGKDKHGRHGDDEDEDD